MLYSLNWNYHFKSIQIHKQKQKQKKNCKKPTYIKIYDKKFKNVYIQYKKNNKNKYIYKCICNKITIDKNDFKKM